MHHRLSLMFVVAILLGGMATHGTVLAISSEQDTDGDGIPDLQEDTDGSGTLDTGETDPYNTDTDAGGESDGSEVRANRNPLDKSDDLTADTDSDSWVNGIELVNGTDPKKQDTDSDGVNDPLDPFPLDPRYSIDMDRNGLPDDWEETTQLNQQNIPQSKVDDPDGDTLTNAEELARGTNPVESDTDRDGIDDNAELNEGTNPRENACFLVVPETRPFEDTVDHWAKAEVSLLKNVRILPQKFPLVRGYVKTTGSGSVSLFAPNQPVTRFEFLKMVLLSTCTNLITLTNRETALSDIGNRIIPGQPADDAFRRQAIYTAVHFSIASGYSDGSFKPDAPVNRAEAVKMLLLAAQIEMKASTGTVLAFSDVSETDWFSPYVNIAVEREIVRGYQDGTFRPDQPITRAEAAKIIGIVMRQNPTVNGYVLPIQE
ncbi:S-layer homology domain-containing protein [Candidatus Peribacteria bacterium]|nr:S-layer homology domain-containing protein [Candidatus Peribacteria bacterium]